MTYLWIAVIVILMIIIIWQYQFIRQRSRALEHIQHKLHVIVSESSSEKVMVFTDDEPLIGVLNEINILLDYHLKSLAAHARIEISTKKMLSNISHDLKTPLTVVLGYLETIKLDSGMEQGERDRLLHNVHRKTLEVLDLINQFFDLAKLESGDKDIPITKLHLNEICRMSMLQYYDILSTRGFKVSIDIPDTPLYVWGNEDALNRILNNLISNAIQHGGDGKEIGITVSGMGQEAFFSVWDKGKGIHELHVDQVFERMYTLEDSRNKAFQGSGLGLTITKRLVEAIGGTIELRSKPNERTTFKVCLRKINY
ncbi:sensor histidine kinase [Paenibacillus taiwanensis]|uniref:sensor histidine kinase n=1 Tax=Paenibacillus taiwanensis TaxID=401638 RepID=UPI0003F4C687|nr:sensor histidine kinase [Paenibacillus taiwanensis]